MTQFDAEQPDLAPTRVRTSALAVTSLVLSLICCIPGVSALGALVGVGGVIGISRSEGRVRGMGLAVAGVVLGLVFTLLWILLLIGLSSSVSMFSGYANVFEAIESGDRQRLDAWVSTSTTATVTDEDIADFRQAYQAEHGAFVSIPDNLWGLISDYMAVGQQIQPAQMAATNAGYANPAPVPADFDSGKALFLVVPSQTEMGPNNMPRIENLAIVASDGSLIWLMDPAAARGGGAGAGSAGDGSGDDGADDTGAGGGGEGPGGGGSGGG